MSAIIYALAKNSLAHFCASAAEKITRSSGGHVWNYPANEDAMLWVKLDFFPKFTSIRLLQIADYFDKYFMKFDDWHVHA